MTLPLTELLLGLDLATMVVFGMLLRRKKGLRAAVICLCAALAVSISQICCWKTSGQSAGVLSRKFNNKAARLLWFITGGRLFCIKKTTGTAGGYDYKPFRPVRRGGRPISTPTHKPRDFRKPVGMSVCMSGLATQKATRISGSRWGDD